MAPAERDDATWTSYDRSFREDAHQLLAWGHADCRRSIKANSQETEITGFIVDAIETRLNSSTIDERFDRYSIKEDNPTAGEGRSGRRRRRLDVIVESTSRPRHKPRPKYVFEAKRLRRSDHLIGDYVGNEGILRFVNSQYAANCPEVAMVGYVQSEDALYWIARLHEEFVNDSGDKFRIIGGLVKVNVIPELADEWRSRHRRAGAKPVFIFHIMLDCFSIVPNHKDYSTNDLNLFERLATGTEKKEISSVSLGLK